jgi:hypothetical protein
LNETLWSFLGLAIFSLTVLFAVRAYRELRGRGVDTLPWVLAFLLAGPLAVLVYDAAGPRRTRA